MTNCPNCGESVIEGTMFCMKCGRPLPREPKEEQALAPPAEPTCSNCGAKLAAGSLFCMNCGHKVAPPATSSPVGEGFHPLPQQPAPPTASPSPVGEGFHPLPQQPAPPPASPSPVGAGSSRPEQPAPQPASPSPVGEGFHPLPQQPSPTPPAQTYAPPPPTSPPVGEGFHPLPQQPAPPPASPSPVGEGFHPLPQQPLSPPPPVASAPQPPEEKDSAAAKKPFYKQTPVIIAAAAVVLLIAAAIFLLGSGVIAFGGGSSSSAPATWSNDYLGYMKDGELQVANIKSLESFAVSSDLMSGNSNRARGGDPSLYGQIIISKNNNRIFYPDRIIDDGSFNLYTRTVSGGKTAGEAVRIDTDVRGGFLVAEDSKHVFYVKGEAGTLYSHDLKDKTKIAGDVVQFVIDKTGSRIYYTDKDDNLYFKNKKADPEKIDSASEYIGSTPDLSTVYYIKDGTFYRRKAGDSKERIAAGVINVELTCENGGVYYTKETESDGKTVGTLCYYDGSTEVKLGAGMEFRRSLAKHGARNVLVYTVNTGDSKESEYRIAVNGKDAAIDVSKNFMSPAVNHAGTKLYYIDDYNDNRKAGDLWAADITESGLKQPGRIYEDVNDFDLMIKGGVRYLSEINKSGDAGELYVDGKLTDTDVYSRYSVEIADTGNILYYTDYNAGKERGALKIAEKNKPSMISDDVAVFAPLGGKTVAYLVIEGSSKSGELYRYDGSKDKKKLSSDVTSVYPVFPSGARKSMTIYNSIIW